jgi:hypothetical protein
MLQGLFMEFINNMDDGCNLLSVLVVWVRVALCFFWGCGWDIHYNKKMLLYTKWFHLILSEFTGYGEGELVKKWWIHWSNE